MPAIALLPLTIWLAACVWRDIKTRQVPNTLTLSALLLAAIWRATQGDWLVVGMVLALIAISDLPHTARILLAGAAWMAVILFGSTAQGNLSHALFAAWVLWELGVMGGADTKMLTALLLFIGDPLLLVAVFLAGGLQGLIGLLRKEKSIPYTVAIAAGTVWFLVAQLLRSRYPF
jgi:Flp pilus assembly protein protease CpaA